RPQMRAVITTIAPVSGRIGTQVTVSGSGLDVQGAGTMWLASKPRAVISGSDTQIAARAATGAMSGPVQIRPTGPAATSLPFPAADSPPVIATIMPAIAAPGSAVTIFGSGFGAARGRGAVSIGGAAPTITSWSATQIWVVVPASASTGVVKVQQNAQWS